MFGGSERVKWRIVGDDEYCCVLEIVSDRVTSSFGPMPRNMADKIIKERSDIWLRIVTEELKRKGIL